MTIEMDSLRSTFSGEIILPADAAYDEARATFNATIDRRPAAIVRPRSTAEVSAAVRWARDTGLQLAVRGGGHSVAGHGVAEGALTIDLREMHEIHVDPIARRARVGGGARWEDVDTATLAHGLATTGGTFGDTGVGGLTLGGGIGFLMGTAGLTCDNLVGAEVVTADGSIVVVTAGGAGDPELLWALRGGGGNFGVVTAFEFALHPVAPVWVAVVKVALADTGAALEAMADLAREAPNEAVIFAGGPVMLEPGAPGGTDPTAFRITVAYQGGQEAADRFIAPLRRLPVIDASLTSMSYRDLQLLNGRLPFGLRHYWKGHCLRDLEPSAIDVITATIQDRPAPPSFLLLEAITGAARHEPAGGAAFGQRAARWNVSALAIWTDPADDARQVAWARAVAEGLRPASLTGAGYANYASADESTERVLAAFGPERFARLAEVKRRYDPANVFRANLNIPPADQV